MDWDRLSASNGASVPSLVAFWVQLGCILHNLQPTTLKKPKPVYVVVQAQCGNLSWKRTHTELVRKRSSTVVSAR